MTMTEKLHKGLQALGWVRTEHSSRRPAYVKDCQFRKPDGTVYSKPVTVFVLTGALRMSAEGRITDSTSCPRLAARALAAAG